MDSCLKRKKILMRESERYKGVECHLKEVDVYDEEMYYIDNYGAVFLGADSFAQNEVVEIIEHLMKKGFCVVSMEVCTKLSKRELEDVFLVDSTCWESDDFWWWMISDSVKNGPMVALLLYNCQANQDNTCLDMLNVHKGIGNPYKAKKGTIRHDFSSINKCMNLIHIPDNFVQMIKDLSPFYTYEELKGVIRESKNVLTKEMRNLLTYEDISYLKLLSKDEHKISFYNVLYFLKYQILRRISRKTETVISLRKISIEKATHFLVFLDRDDNLQEMRNAFLIERELVKKLIQDYQRIIAINEPKASLLMPLSIDFFLINVYAILCDEERFSEMNEQLLNRVLEEKIIVGEFEKVVLLTTCAHWNK